MTQRRIDSTPSNLVILCLLTSVALSLLRTGKEWADIYKVQKSHERTQTPLKLKCASQFGKRSNQRWTFCAFLPLYLQYTCFRFILYYEQVQSGKSLWDFTIDPCVSLVCVSKSSTNICAQDGLDDLKGFPSSSVFEQERVPFPGNFWCLFFRRVKRVIDISFNKEKVRWV